MTALEKSVENRVRRAVQRQGGKLRKSKARDPRSLTYGRYWVTLQGMEQGGERGWTLEHVERHLGYGRDEWTIYDVGDLATRWNCTMQQVVRVVSDGGMTGLQRQNMVEADLPDYGTLLEDFTSNVGHLTAEYTSPDGSRLYFAEGSVFFFESEHPEIRDGRIDELAARLELAQAEDLEQARRAFEQRNGKLAQ